MDLNVALENNGLFDTPEKKNKYVMGVSLRQTKRKTQNLIIQIQNLIKSKQELNTIINEKYYALTHMAEDRSNQIDKVPLTPPFLKKISSAFTTLGPVLTCFGALGTVAACMWSSSSSIITIPIAGSVFIAGSLNMLISKKEKELLGHHLTHLEIAIKLDKDLTKETINLAANYFNELDEFLNVVESVVFLGGIEIPCDLRSYKNFFEATYAKSFLWFDCVMDLIGHWHPLIRQLDLQASFWRSYFERMKNCPSPIQEYYENNNLYNSLEAFRSFENVFSGETPCNLEHLLTTMRRFTIGVGRNREELLQEISEGLNNHLNYFIDSKK